MSSAPRPGATRLAGFHTRGEMGGVWTPPIKLVDGIWFGVGERVDRPGLALHERLGPREDAPAATPAGCASSAPTSCPASAAACWSACKLSGPTSHQTVDLRMQTHSELMSIYPWGETTPGQTDFNLPDSAGLRRAARSCSRESGTPPVPNAIPHDWGAAVGSRADAHGPTRPATASAARRADVDLPGLRPEHRRRSPTSRATTPPTARARAASSPTRSSCPRSGATTVWFGVAGSESGAAGARAELAQAARRPRARAAREAARARGARAPHPARPAGRPAARARHRVEQAEPRRLRAGGARPRAARGQRRQELPGAARPRWRKARFVGAGFPDYPWLFATDGEFTAFASVALGQFEPIKEHMRALKEASIKLNDNSGKVVHEVVTDGSVYFGANADAGNTDETAKFPSAVALIWRWTGDDAFRDEMYGVREVEPGVHLPRARHRTATAGRRVSATSSGPAWARRSSTTRRLPMRGLRDLEDLAEVQGRHGDRRRGRGPRPRASSRASSSAWWMDEIPQHADSLDDPGNVQVQQRHWIGVTPMEIETVRDGRGRCPA